MAQCEDSSQIVLNLDIKHQEQIKDSLNEVESHIDEWLHSAQYQHKWKHHKTAINEYLNIDCDNNADIQNIIIHCLNDIENKKFKVWRAMGYLPCKNPKTAIKYYTVPKYHLEYDDLDRMKKLQRFIIDMDAMDNDYNDLQDINEYTEYDINVAVTNSALNGLISSRLCVNMGCTKYSDKMDGYCALGRFMNESMIKQLKDKLYITRQDMKYVLSKNLNLYWGAKPVIIELENNINIQLTQITYILQINNGGWIPQWAVEIGLIDQHLIAIFKQITKWLNIQKKDMRELSIDDEREQELNVDVDDEIKTEIKTEIMIKNEDEINNMDDIEDEKDILSTDSNIESFNKFVDSKGFNDCDWIDIDDDDEALLLLSKPSKLDIEQKVIKEIIYNKIEDLEIESNDEHEDIEIVKMQDFENNDDDELLSDGVYVDDIDTFKIKKDKQQRCASLIDEKNQCLVM